ncbi:MAG: hypothetical protein FD163_1587 [Hyphomonadaceae bacterium]|nr:MAG: hypothetical protein FD128_2163 [Hyphomonadaceae bacterium]KAF0184890.1 MAG: hypothetical protein FD163_1587 [Hyphomonadaceae bacterium]
MADRKHDFNVVFKNIENKSGKTLNQIIAAAHQCGKAKGQIKATEFYQWAMQEFGLGRGHAQAIWINFDEFEKPES